MDFVILFIAKHRVLNHNTQSTYVFFFKTMYYSQSPELTHF